MLVDISVPNKPENGSIAVWKGGKWVFVGKSAYLEPYMQRNEATEAKLTDLKAEFKELQKDFAALEAEYSALSADFRSLKASVNEKLKEYHDVLRLLANE